jgi:flagellar protein FliL
MADEEKTVVKEGGEEAAAPKNSPIKKYGIMLGIVVVMAVGGYFVTLKFVKPIVGDESAELTEGGDESGGDHDAPKKKKKKKKKSEHGKDGSVETHIFEVGDVIVNPAGTGGTRFLSASIGFEVEDVATMELFKARQPQIRDALITILGSKNIEQLTDMKQKEIARLQIKKRVIKLLDTEELVAVYFTDFVIQ